MTAAARVPDGIFVAYATEFATSVQVGSRHGDDVVWLADLDSPELVDDLVAGLQRAKRRVWPRATGGPIEPGIVGLPEGPRELVVHTENVRIMQRSEHPSPGAELHSQILNDAFNRMKGDPT